MKTKTRFRRRTLDIVLSIYTNREARERPEPRIFGLRNTRAEHRENTWLGQRASTIMVPQFFPVPYESDAISAQLTTPV